MSMNVSNEKTISVLQNLVETNRDGQHGFRTAAEDAKDAELGRVFTQFSTQRSVTGSLHRGWIDLKSAISSNEPHAVLAEAERGEDAAVKAYREALEENLDPVTRGIVSRQYASVQAAHDRVKGLRDSVAYAAKH